MFTFVFKFRNADGTWTDALPYEFHDLTADTDAQTHAQALADTWDAVVRWNRLGWNPRIDHAGLAVPSAKRTQPSEPVDGC